MKNFPLLHKVLDHIEAHPEEWDQTEWAREVMGDDGSCWTAYCFAGTAVAMMEDWTPTLLLRRRGVLRSAPGTCYLNRRVTTVPDAASELLGLNYDEGNRLFESSNTLDDIRALIHYWEFEE
jgi:hypothetical protein